MGLAPYGSARKELKMLAHNPDENMYVSTYQNTTKMFYPGIQPHATIFGLRQSNIPQRESKKKWDFEDPKDTFYADLAASAQNSVEEAGVHYVKRLNQETGEKNLCLTGGVALNSCLNGLIRRNNIYESSGGGSAPPHHPK